MNIEEGEIIKKFFVLAIVFSLAVCSGDLLAQERKKLEFDLSAVGVTVEDEGLWIILGGVVNLEFYPMREVGIELGGIIIISKGAGAFITGNVIVNSFNLQRINPYVIGGLWTNTVGGFG